MRASSAETADLMEIAGEDSFRIRSYRNGATAIDGYPERVIDILRDPNRKITEIPGIGKGLAAVLQEIVDRGSCERRDELLKISVWRDRDSIIGGRQWREAITTAIRGASVFVACLSGNYFQNPASFISGGAGRRLGRGGQKAGRPVPGSSRSRSGDTTRRTCPPALRRTLQDLHVVDATADVEAGLGELLSLLMQLTKPDEYWRLLLRQRLEAHLRSQESTLTSSSTLRVTQVEERWTALLDDPVITPLSTAFIQVLEKADMTKAHQAGARRPAGYDAARVLHPLPRHRPVQERAPDQRG